ncbi:MULTISPECIES: hypothetical protein [Streptomyces]|uniref:Lipoprotein n=1 Tax=Streptomyces harbinensis TaxID=1176198 RepID=A0A1I6W2M2_9ACTN|nr:MULTISPECIES: hypothetical protein [Streptomyces]QKV71069.1 hypothetical protein HUT13_21605 [Streptomyces harbinensis]SFT20215.1 hypothetical protein SAMN05444716_11214 [Streptomyces harbinensis]
MTTATRRGPRGRAVAPFLVLLLLAACSQSSQDTSRVAEESPAPTSPAPSPSIDPAEFVDEIDNPYLPLAPGTGHHFDGICPTGPASLVTEVTQDREEIMGVSTLVVRERRTCEGEPVAEVRQFYAQDEGGNVWYFGRDAGGGDASWRAGTDGAQPGVVMLAEPMVGEIYQQEFVPGVAEDEGQVISMSEDLTISLGQFSEVLKIRESSRLDPGVVTEKYYAKELGLIRSQRVEGGNNNLELAEITGVD